MMNPVSHTCDDEFRWENRGIMYECEGVSNGVSG